MKKTPTQVEWARMIWSEILDENGQVIKDTTRGNIPIKGFTNMWVIVEDRCEYHHARLKVGTKGFWWRGGRVAHVTVIQINAIER